MNFKHLNRLILEPNIIYTTVRVRNDENKLSNKSDHRRDSNPQPHGFRGLLAFTNSSTKVPDVIDNFKPLY